MSSFSSLSRSLHNFSSFVIVSSLGSLTLLAWLCSPCSSSLSPSRYMNLFLEDDDDDDDEDEHDVMTADPVIGFRIKGALSARSSFLKLCRVLFLLTLTSPRALLVVLVVPTAVLAVSYTHLDVYKRQTCIFIPSFFLRRYYMCDVYAISK